MTFKGETGKALTTEILKNNIFKSAILIGRRKVEYDQEFYKNGVDFTCLINTNDKNEQF